MDFNENVISYNFEDKTLNINGARVTGVSSYSLKKVRRKYIQSNYLY